MVFGLPDFLSDALPTLPSLPPKLLLSRITDFPPSPGPTVVNYDGEKWKAFPTLNKSINKQAEKNVAAFLDNLVETALLSIEPDKSSAYNPDVCFATLCEFRSAFGFTAPPLVCRTGGETPHRLQLSAEA